MNSPAILLSAMAWCGMASAATILIDSQQGLFTNFAGVETVAITPHSAWEPNHPTNPGDASDSAAVWISFADTGFGGTHFQPSAGTTPVVTIFDTFQSGAGMLSLYVWADDTASVLLDGNLLMPAVFTQSVCSGQAPRFRKGNIRSASCCFRWARGLTPAATPSVFSSPGRLRCESRSRRNRDPGCRNPPLGDCSPAASAA